MFYSLWNQNRVYKSNKKNKTYTTALSFAHPLHLTFRLLITTFIIIFVIWTILKKILKNKVKNWRAQLISRYISVQFSQQRYPVTLLKDHRDSSFWCWEGNSPFLWYTTMCFRVSWRYGIHMGQLWMKVGPYRPYYLLLFGFVID